MEEFCNCLPREIRTHLSDRGVEQMEKAAIVADDYELVHKSSFGQSQNPRVPNYFKGKGKYGRSGEGNDSDTRRGSFGNAGSRNRPTCSFCHKIGHVYESCFKRLREIEKPTAFIASKQKLIMGSPLIQPNYVKDNSIFSKSKLSSSQIEKIRANLKPHGYDNFMSVGTVTRPGSNDFSEIHILRDTGASRSLMLRNVFSPSHGVETSPMHVLVRGMGEDTVRAPLVKLQLDCEYVSKVVEIGVVERLPVDGIDFLLGNDIAGGQVHTSPCVHVCNQPQSNEETERLLTEFPGIFPACVTTRSMALKAPNVNDTNVPTGDECFQLAGTFFENLNDLSRENQFNKNPAKNADVVKPLVLDQQHLIERQKADDQIKKLLQSVHTEQEISKIPVGYYMSKSGVLMRKWRHPEVAANEEWLVFHQIVVPSEYRAQIIQVAHDHAMSGHLGVRKTRDRILRHFFWPKLYKDMDWDKGIDFVVFATRETPNESTGFSPFELIYGHEVRGPLKLMKEKWLTDSPAEVNVLDYVSDLNERLHKASKLAKDNLLKSQDRMKKRFDQKSKERSFQTGEKVLVLLPVHGEPLRARFSGPYRVAKKISDVNYIIDTPGRLPKEDGSQRLCIDYRKVNSVTVTDSHPIPRLDDCIDRIGNSKFVSKYDLLKGYWQVPLTKRAKEISTFVTPDGVWACNVMPFGMKNAPSTFTRLMNIVCKGLKGCGTYIDDVILYSDSWQSHIEQTKDFFERLKSANLTINLNKSDLGKASVTYLGHVVGGGKVLPKTAKVEAIYKFPVPSNKKELMRFLGMTGFYRKFCPNFADVASPLTSLLAKKVKFLWSECCQTAFENLKLILISEPVLAAPNFKISFSMTIDASDVGVGAVLFQEDDQKVEHPVIYFSKKLNQSQRNYSTIDKEALALILSVGHFEVYLNGPYQTVVYTDHNPLVYINKFKNKSARLMRWSILLQGYDLKIVHIPGKENICADALSRVG
ncbi:hypothetical protein BSL78_29612 [Apostichopus japonicus]|uniref:Reverse transcriptase n=1 Tax=Stichopus japonicus TaxID=307972 RepID=A0A2G8JCV3_STIJA|nr:hypothetical protein BSL78_29612 [Apostichopus japonicus]